MNRTLIFGFLTICLLMMACKSTPKLPILGERKVVNGDTVYATIPAFQFTDQNGDKVDLSTVKHKIYVADFVFLSCPTICPVMTKNLLKVYHSYEKEEKLIFISHTIDPKRDTIERLKLYADGIGVNARKWHFVTGKEEQIHEMANKGYFMQAFPDKNAPGGYAHSGGFLLIDTKRRIRGVYDGTSPHETERLIQDIQVLLKEVENP